MNTVTINEKEWEELSCKIDRIAVFIKQFAEQLPVDENTWMSESQVCGYLKISTKTLQRLRKSGDISFSDVGKKHFYKVSEVKRLLERKAVKSSREYMRELKDSAGKRFSVERKSKD
jgi:3-methyladenine DNA glycosylase Tag